MPDKPHSLHPDDLHDPGAHEQFVQTLHGMDAVGWEMDARTWRFTWVSPRAERMFGYPVRDWYEDPTFWQDRLLHPDDRAWCVDFCTVASADCRNHAFLYRARAADGRVLWIKDVVRVIPDAEGRASLMRGVMLDVTAERATHALEHGAAIDYDAPELAALRDILAA